MLISKGIAVILCISLVSCLNLSDNSTLESSTNNVELTTLKGNNIAINAIKNHEHPEGSDTTENHQREGSDTTENHQPEGSDTTEHHQPEGSDTIEHYQQNSTSSYSSEFQRRRKPLRRIVLGIYKNFRNTYLVNRTSSRYRDLHQGYPSAMLLQDEIELQPLQKMSKMKKRKKKRRRTNDQKRRGYVHSFEGEYRYNIGTGVNVSLDMNRHIVSVNLDEDCLKDVLTGFTFDDYDEEGRTKEDNKQKYEMLSKVLPLFILPFLIQSALIPFIVAKLKLLLIKSIIVGKLAIFLLIFSAIKNSQKQNNYEPQPEYWAWEPSRRSDMYQGYKVDGRPHIWVS